MIASFAMAMVLALGASTAAPVEGNRALVELLDARIRARAGLDETAEVAISDLRSARTDRLADPAAIVDLTLPPGERGYGRVSALVTLAEGEHAWVLARVRIERPTVVLRRAMKRGEVIAPGDVAVELRQIRGGAPLSEPERAVGKALRRAMGAGAPVSARYLEAPTAVRRGDRLTVVVRSRGFAVEAGAEALGSAAVGETVRLRVLATGRIVRGRLLGRDRAEVER